jgi:hypothetical protein
MGEKGLYQDSPLPQSIPPEPPHDAWSIVRSHTVPALDFPVNSRGMQSIKAVVSPLQRIWIKPHFSRLLPNLRS